jgi:TolA protein
MKKSFLGSVSFHALLVLAALFGIPNAKPFEIQPVEAIQVDISNITDTTKVKAQTKSDEPPTEKPKPKASKAVEKSKPQEKVTEEKKVAAKEPEKQEPPPPEPEKKKPEPEKPKEPEKKVEDTPVDPDPLKDMIEAEDAQLKKAEEKKKDEAKKKKAEEEKKKKDEEAKAKAEADAKAKADAKKKSEAEKKARKLDVAQLEDLLNKENEEATSTLEKKDESGTPEKAEKDMQGADDAMSATIIDGLRQRFSECWSIPPGVKESQETVDLTWRMSKDGRVVGQPVVIGGSGGVTAQQAAISAVKACEPYDWLPQDAYHLWKEIEWTFAPR